MGEEEDVVVDAECVVVLGFGVVVVVYDVVAGIKHEFQFHQGNLTTGGVSINLF